MRLLFGFLLCTAAWGAAISSAGAGSWSSTASWTGGVVPGLGDTVTITHAITQDVPNLVVGVNGALPASMYLQDIAPSGSGYTNTTCTLTLSGGTAVGIPTTPVTDCIVVGGVVTPLVYFRGAYSVCPTSYTITGLTGGSGAVTSGTPTCATTGTAAVAVGQGGSLTIAADTYVRGTMQVYGNSGNTTTGLTVNPGKSLYMDMTQAAGALYRIEAGRPVIASCASSQCSIQGYGGATVLHPGTTGGTGGASVVITANNVLFKNVGNATSYFSWVGRNGSSVVNSIFDTCGIFFLQGMTGADTFTFTGNLFRNTAIQNPRKEVIDFFSQTSSTKTTGTRVFTGNSLDGAMDSPQSNGANQVNDFTVTGNSFGDLGTGGLQSQALWNNNLQRVTPNYYISWGVSKPVGTFMQYVYTWIDGPIASNPHTYSASSSVNSVISNSIFGQNAIEVTDSGEWLGGFTTASKGVQTYNNNIFLCSSEGIGPQEIGTFSGLQAALSGSSTTLSGGVVSVVTQTAHNLTAGIPLMFVGTAGITGLNTTFSGTASITDSTHFTISCPSCTGTSASGGYVTQSASWVITNNTFCGGYGNFGFADVNETTNTVPGMLTMRNNLLYALSPSSSMKIFSTPGAGTQDVCTTTDAQTSNCDYNAAYNYATTQTCVGCTNQGRSYGGVWSFTPGYHDQDDKNPNFVDTGVFSNHGRKLENFDQSYLGKPLAAAWSSGGTYAYGDLVSNTVTTMYNNEALNYRCKAVAGCTGAPPPGWAGWLNYILGTTTSNTVTVPAGAGLTTLNPLQVMCIAGSTAIPITSYSGTGSPFTSVTLNYTSAANVTCYVASNWRDWWEFAGYYWVRDRLFAQATYTDSSIGCSSCTVIQALNNWIIAGQTPQNPAFLGTGYAGANIGAVTPNVRKGALVPIIW